MAQPSLGAPESVTSDAGQRSLRIARPVRSPASDPLPRTAIALAAPTTFERFELKYWLTEPLAERVLAFAEPYLRPDPYSSTRDAQRNTSLYLDTRGFRFYENHLALSPDRIKLRIRTYGHPLGKTAFFEVKRKVKTITMKQRFMLPFAEIENVLRRRPVSSSMPESVRPAFDDFMFHMTVHRVEPKVYVACFRQAFESRIPGEGVRLTVDRELVYQPASGLAFAPDDRRWMPIHDGEDSRPAFGTRRSVLELKFKGSPPRWMVDLVRHFDLQREAFSKYTTAVQQLRARH